MCHCELHLEQSIFRTDLQGSPMIELETKVKRGAAWFANFAIFADKAVGVAVAVAYICFVSDGISPAKAW